MANPKLDKKDEAILKVLKDYPEGIRGANVKKLTGFKGRTCYNHLEKLAEMKILDNIYPIWKIRHDSGTQEIMAKLQDSDKNTEGHRIWWILPLVRKPFWWDKRKDRLMRLKGWNYKKETTAHDNIYFQIENDYMEIQTFKNSIYFICKEKYLEHTDFEVFDKAKNDVLGAIKYLEERFRFQFLAENEFHLTLVDNHFVTMGEMLAEHYYKQGKKFRIETKDGYSLWIDLSDPKGLEGDNVEIKRRYLELVKDVVENPQTPLPSEIYKIEIETKQNLKLLSEAMIYVQKDLPVVLNEMSKQIGEYHQENMGHLALLNDWRNEAKDRREANATWRKNEVQRIRKELKKGRQTKLMDFF